ncbi:hypothetical protein TruAng_011548 [Truncatella angustata]|nr:hypothetical protein TruAng_011548 [Truncatella angustata]
MPPQRWLQPIPGGLELREAPDNGMQSSGGGGATTHDKSGTHIPVSPKRVKLNRLPGQSSSFTTPPPPPPQFPPTPISAPRPARPVLGAGADSSSDEGYGPAHDVLENRRTTPASRRQASRGRSPRSDSQSGLGNSNGNGTGNTKKRSFGSPEGPGGGGTSRPSGPGGPADDGAPSEKSDDGDGDDGTVVEPTGFADLREDQKQLHVIRKYPWQIALCPDTWEGHLEHLNVPKALFFKRTSDGSNWPRIYERTPGQDFHGGKIFAALYNVQTRVHDIHTEYAEEKMGFSKDYIAKAADAETFRAKYFKAVKKTIDKAIKWAWKDGQIERWVEFPPSVTVLDVSDMNTLTQTRVDITEKLEALRTRWKMAMDRHQRKSWPQGRIPQSPVIWAFAVMEHNVVLLSLDASNDDALPLAETNMDFCTETQRQWHAALIMVTICFARDRMMALVRHVGPQNLDSPVNQDDDDPDV